MVPKIRVKKLRRREHKLARGVARGVLRRLIILGELPVHLRSAVVLDSGKYQPLDVLPRGICATAAVVFWKLEIL